MKHKFKLFSFFVIGFLAAFALIFGSANAATISKALNAVYKDIRIVVNGESFTPTDAAGKAVEPFIVDGTTYVPLRAVAQALSVDVNWDANTSTIYLGLPPTLRVTGITP